MALCHVPGLGSCYFARITRPAPSNFHPPYVAFTRPHAIPAEAGIQEGRRGWHLVFIHWCAGTRRHERLL